MFGHIVNIGKTIFINLVLIIGTLGICSVVAEVGLRVADVNKPQVQTYTLTLDDSWGATASDVNVINPIPPTLGRDGYVMHPYIGLTSIIYLDRLIDVHGQPISHASDVCNIGILGGSVAMHFGQYERKVGNLVEYLSNKYQHSRCKTFAVVNLALGGSYAPSQLYAFLQNLDVLDLVVVIDGFNEVTSGIAAANLWPVDWPPHMYYQDFLYLGVRKNLGSGIQVQLFKELYKSASRISQRLETDQRTESSSWLGHSKLLRYLSASIISYASQRVVDLQQEQLTNISSKKPETPTLWFEATQSFRGYVSHYPHLEEAWRTIQNNSNSLDAQYWRPRMGWDKGNQNVTDFGRAHAKENNEVLLQYIADISPKVFARLVDTGIDNSQTTIPLSTTEGFASKGTVTLGQEQITYTGISGNSLTGATRGANNTTGIAHGAGSRVTSDTAIWTNVKGENRNTSPNNSRNNTNYDHETHIRDTIRYRQKIWAKSAVLLDVICKKFGIPIVHVLQPVLLPGVKPRTPLETNFGYHNLILTWYPLYDAHIQELDRLGVPIHNFKEIFADFTGDAYIDVGHLSDAGNKIMSDRLIEVMEINLPGTLQADNRAPNKIDWKPLYGGL